MGLYGRIQLFIIICAIGMGQACVGKNNNNEVKIFRFWLNFGERPWLLPIAVIWLPYVCQVASTTAYTYVECVL